MSLQQEQGYGRKAPVDKGPPTPKEKSPQADSQRRIRTPWANQVVGTSLPPSREGVGGPAKKRTADFETNFDPDAEKLTLQTTKTTTKILYLWSTDAKNWDVASLHSALCKALSLREEAPNVKKDEDIFHALDQCIKELEGVKQPHERSTLVLCITSHAAQKKEKSAYGRSQCTVGAKTLDSKTIDRLV